MNRYTATGNLVSDPEHRVLPSGTTICELRLASDELGRNGHTGYINVTTFGKQADAAAKVLRKGWKVAVDGRLEHRQWKTDDGHHREALTVIGHVEFLHDPRPARDAPEVATVNRRANDDADDCNDGQPDNNDSQEDDIPFLATVIGMASATSTELAGAISLVDQLLELRARVAITQQDIMQATGASLGEVNTWLKREAGPVGEQAKLLGDLVTAVDRLALSLDPEGVPAWLRRKVPALDDRTPLEVVRAGGYATLVALADEILDPPFA